MKYLKPLTLFREVLKSNDMKKSRLLGLCLGDNNYVGLAVSDVRCQEAYPVRKLLDMRINIDVTAYHLQSLVSELSVGGVIIGFPLDDYKRESKLKQMKDFICHLDGTKKCLHLKYTHWDEYFSSKLKQMKDFICHLDGTKKCLHLKYTHWDEYFSSKSVDSILEPFKLELGKVKYTKAFVKFAAASMLQGYMDYELESLEETQLVGLQAL